jgi:LPXTG-motif cell wall-anchored protein
VARSELAIRVRDLEANAGTPQPTVRRPLVPAWSAVIVGMGLLGLALALLLRRRRRLELGVPDPIASP